MVKYKGLTMKVETKYLLESWISGYHFFWHQESRFIQNQKPILQPLTLQTYAQPHLQNMALWFLKGECMVYGPYAMSNAYHNWKAVPLLLNFWNQFTVSYIYHSILETNDFFSSDFSVCVFWTSWSFFFLVPYTIYNTVFLALLSFIRIFFHSLLIATI